MITIKNLKIKFKSLVLNVDDITFKYGNIYGITGESGAGKSCFLDCVSLTKKNWGFSYFYENKEVFDYERFKSEHIAYLSQSDNLLEDLTCFEHLSLVYGNKNISEDILQRFSINFDLSIFSNSLSGGEKLRFSLLLAYLSQADILVLDEITASLDEENTERIASLLIYLAHEENKMIILSTHDQKVIDFCDVVYHIEYCELVQQRKNENDKPVVNSIHNISRGDFFKNLILPQYKRFDNKKLFLIILSVLMLCMSLSGMQVAFAHSEEFKDAVDKVGREQSYIVSENRWIDNSILPFATTDIKNYLDSNENVVSYYPFSNFMITSRYIDSRTYFTRENSESNKLIDLENSDGSFLFNYEVTNNNQTRTVSQKVDTKQFGEQSIYPYFDETALDYKCIQKVDVEGIFLSADFATKLGITELDENTLITLSFLVPSIRLQLVSRDTQTGETLNETSKFINYDVERLTFKVRGILDRQYIQLSNNYLFFLDSGEYNEILESHTSKVESTQVTDITNSNYQQKLPESKYTEKMRTTVLSHLNRYSDKIVNLTVNIEPFQHNSYTVFTKKNASIKNIENDIKSLNENYSVINMSEMMHQVKFNTDILDKYFNSFSIGFIIVVIIFSFVINNYNKKKRSCQFTILSRYGFSKKELKNFLESDIKFNILLNIIIGIGFLLAANIMVVLFGFIKFNGVYLKTCIVAFIALLPISVVLAILQNFSSYSLVKNYDKH